MPFIYIVAESEADALFYIALAERIHATAFQFEPIYTRRGNGFAQASRMVKHMVDHVSNSSGGGPGIFWIAAVDNDRAPQYPDGAQPAGILAHFDQHKRCRYADLHALASAVGVTETGAIAVPVEMIESWVLQCLSTDAVLDLPSFSEQASPLAIKYYQANHRHPPPPQLKDLACAAMQEHGYQDWTEFLIHVAGRVDADLLAQQSRSFAQFHEAVKSWQVT